MNMVINDGKFFKNLNKLLLILFIFLLINLIISLLDLIQSLLYEFYPLNKWYIRKLMSHQIYYMARNLVFNPSSQLILLPASQDDPLSTYEMSSWTSLVSIKSRSSNLLKIHSMYCRTDAMAGWNLTVCVRVRRQSEKRRDVCWITHK